MARGVTWVLSRLRLENPVAIALGDEVEIETWPSGMERLFALREFVVRRRADGAEVARASTQWLVLDLATRKPVRPAEVLDPRFPLSGRVEVSIVDRGTPASGRAAELRAALWEQLGLVIRFRAAENGKETAARDQIAARVREREDEQADLVAAVRAGAGELAPVAASERSPAARGPADGAMGPVLILGSH
jgi:hypothetical protein